MGGIPFPFSILSRLHGRFVYVCLKIELKFFVVDGSNFLIMRHVHRGQIACERLVFHRTKNFKLIHNIIHS